MRPLHGLAETIAELCGGVAVPFFFVISGFLVTRSWLTDPRPGDFLQKRVLRIYPGFLAASLFCALVVGPLGPPMPPPTGTSFSREVCALGLVLVGPYIPTIFVSLPMSTGVNGSFWTLRYEGYCYLFVLALGLLGLYRRRGALLAVFLVLYVLRETQTLTGHIFLPGPRAAPVRQHCLLVVADPVLPRGDAVLSVPRRDPRTRARSSWPASARSCCARWAWAIWRSACPSAGLMPCCAWRSRGGSGCSALPAAGTSRMGCTCTPSPSSSSWSFTPAGI